MSDALSELTDKEKEALRLLLAGHDAKSSARELDISVHTLNDRLRSARRKLGVTTSKEAARMLNEAEPVTGGATPKILVHEGLGVRETEQDQDIPTAADRKGEGIAHLISRRKGILIVSLFVALSLATVAFFPTQDTATPDNVFVEQQAPSDAELQARRWLGLIDFGKFDESYEEAGAPLREEYELGRWRFGLTLRMTKGEIEERTLASVMRTDEFGGRSESEFEVIIFDSLFEYNNRQLERVVLEKIGEDWKVIDYEITPRDPAPE